MSTLSSADKQQQQKQFQGQAVPPDCQGLVEVTIRQEHEVTRSRDHLQDGGLDEQDVLQVGQAAIQQLRHHRQQLVSGGA